MQRVTEDMPQDKDSRPKRDVTRFEFRQCAVRAGWEKRTIDLFLAPGNPVREYFGCGPDRLRVIDWGT